MRIKMAILFWIRLDQICPNWIKLDQIGSDWFKLVPTGLNWIKIDQHESIDYLVQIR